MLKQHPVARFVLLGILGVFVTLLVYAISLQAVPDTAVAGLGSTPFDPIVNGFGLYTGRNMASGIVSTSNQGIFGPNICVDYGDPYSPLNSPWEPGPYTYQYRIRIPADYANDVVRVELFDPDSINASVNEANILRSQAAINAGMSPGPVLKVCGSDGGSSNRKNPCLLRTDELDLMTGPPNYDIDQVNPHWFVRIDEHRGNGSPPGDGSCGQPSSYNAAFNTATLFQLYYYQSTDNTAERIDLVSYTGQTGDGARDLGDHNTDMRWVSPGADVPFSAVDDPGNAVPVDAGSLLSSFEIDLTQDVPNVFVDPASGDRYLYLDVTSLSGASENGFEIWAGPPDYVDTVPSEVNNRNLHILNNPGAHDSAGVEVLAVRTLPQNSDFSNPVDIPLAYIGPEFAGETINLSLYDSDSGAQPPLIFYFDTLAFTPDDNNPLGYDPGTTDWAMAFGVVGQDDPDGVPEGTRCLPGSCQSQWVDPPYQVKVPGDLSNCDWTNPNALDCTPFYGGRLMVRYTGGFSDSYAWQFPSTPPSPPDPDTTIGCSAFPITIHEGIRSVTPPGTGTTPYPDSTDFDYPPSPPSYESFTNHASNVPLTSAREGYVYLVQNGLEVGNFGWLVWNEGISASSSTLADSLAWPGNSTNYDDHGDSGTILPGFDHVVRGYVESGDPTDVALHVSDWIAASTGSINSNEVRASLEPHIDLGRVLRLPIWDESNQVGADAQYRASEFGIFRVIGYSVGQSGSGSWLLLEFIDWDTSCGQSAVPPDSVTISGPDSGAVNESLDFTAVVSGSTTTQPITYVWETAGQAPITQTNGLSNTVSLSWPSSGLKTVTVSAGNASGVTVSDSFTVTITDDIASTCDAYPLAVRWNARAVTAPGSGSNPYPESADFDYPTAPPLYTGFTDHDPNARLNYADGGDVYRVYPGIGGRYAWLVWNRGIAPTNNTLANSLTYPGDSADYADHGDVGIVLPGFSHVVRGYVNPRDSSDTEINLGDVILASNGSLAAAEVQTALRDHIDNGRLLRLPIWHYRWIGRYRVTGFGLFRLLGYNVGQNWLLLEFVEWDESCGRIDKPVAHTNYDEGAPGSTFALSGSGFDDGETIAVRVNEVSLDSVTADPHGNFAVQVVTGATTEEGHYTAEVQADSGTAVASFQVDADAPEQASEGDDPILNLPDDIAFHLLHLPMIVR